MTKLHALFLIASLAPLACQESVGPTGPAGPVAGPVAAIATCPCWEGGTLATAFPAAHFYLDQGGTAALTRFDHANGQQIQALVTLSAEGGGSCQLASFGAGGIVEALAGAEGLSPEQCAVCAGLLRAPAATFGLVAAVPEDGSAAP